MNHGSGGSQFEWYFEVGFGYEDAKERVAESREGLGPDIFVHGPPIA